MTAVRRSKNSKLPKVIEKPWGREIWFAETPHYLGKFLVIKKGCRLSLQYHKKKHETLYGLQGVCRMQLNSRNFLLKSGMSVVIPPGTIHRMTGIAKETTLVEVSTAHPTDVVRLKDDYGRTQ